MSQVTDGVNRAQGVQVRGPHASASTAKTWRESLSQYLRNIQP